jgi:integrase
MNRKREQKKIRGVFERPSGSNVWWIDYWDHGSRHREKIGRKSDAIDAYRDRKTAIRRGEKLPTLRRIAPVTISDLVDLVLDYVRTHGHKDQRTYQSRGNIIRNGRRDAKGTLIHKGLGDRNAETLTSEDIEAWLGKNCKTPATFNRYKALLSLAYKLGVRNKKVTHNPARGEFIPMRKEPKGRLRFLAEEEYDKLYEVIASRFPEHLAEFVVGTHTGMRLSEQYTVEWGQYDPRRRAIDLDRTKNGNSRTVNLNADAMAAIESLRGPNQKRMDRMFPREDRSAFHYGEDGKRKQEQFDNRSWFEPCVTEAGIPRITWHGLRHTFCSWLAMAGATTRDIMEAAGHKTMNQAARYYHLSPQHTQSVVDRIARTGTRNTNRHHNSHQSERANRKRKQSTKNVRG